MKSQNRWPYLISYLILFILLIIPVILGCQQKKEAILFEANEKIKASGWVSPRTCEGCHSTNYRDWKGTMHSNALRDPLYVAAVTVTTKDAASIGKEREVFAYCTKCHAPLAAFGDHMFPTDGSKMTVVEKEGVQCDFCHRVTKVLGDNMQIKIDKDTDIKRGPYKDSYSNMHRTAYSRIHATSKLCSGCHDVTHPLNGVAVERTFSEWKNSVYSGKDGHKRVECQDCHMKAEPGTPADIPVFGVQRENFYRHRFVGGNTWMTGVLGASKQQQRAVKLLQSAAKLSVEAKKKGPQALLKITVFNEGAGHKLPTGFPEGRLLWLHVIAKDNQGRLVFESGAMDAGGKLVRTATDGGPVKVYEIIPGIKQPDGRAKKSFHIALNDTIVSDNRIPPKEKDVTLYYVPYPETGGLAVDVFLKYQTASKEFVEFLAGNIAPGEPGSDILTIWQNYPPPVVTMETAKIVTP